MSVEQILRIRAISHQQVACDYAEYARGHTTILRQFDTVHAATGKAHRETAESLAIYYQERAAIRYADARFALECLTQAER